MTKQYFVMVIEAKRSSLGEAFKQCLLSMWDMRDSNGVGKMYGFVTTGKSWQMLRYDGVSFQVTDMFVATFHSMSSRSQEGN